MFAALILWTVIGYTKGVTGGATSYMTSLTSTTLKTYSISGSFCVNETRQYKIAVTDFPNAVVQFKTEGSKSVTIENGKMVFTNTFKARTCYPWSYEITTKVAGIFDVTFDGMYLSEFNDLKEQYSGEMTPEATTTKAPTVSPSIAPLKVSYETRTNRMRMTIAPIVWTVFFQ
jgi:hypothetical protein